MTGPVRGVLGIDAAWTAGQPSGVALIGAGAAGWECLGLAPSYTGFLALALGETVDWTVKSPGVRPDVEALLTASRRLLGGAGPLVVAVDMPLSRQAITGRRPADDHISRAFGARKCGTHSPSADRPGQLADELARSFGTHGFALATAATLPGTPSRLLEVYPHPALLTLLGARERVPYKVGRTRVYWPAATPTERRANICAVLQSVLDGLQREITGIPLVLPQPAELAGVAPLKRFEDALDALVCAWVGAKYLAGEVAAYGDAEAAIWVPIPDQVARAGTGAY